MVERDDFSKCILTVDRTINGVHSFSLCVCERAVPGSDVQCPVDLEDPLDVKRLLPQPGPMGSAQEHRVSSHHCR